MESLDADVLPLRCWKFLLVSANVTFVNVAVFRSWLLGSCCSYESVGQCTFTSLDLCLEGAVLRELMLMAGSLRVLKLQSLREQWVWEREWRERDLIYESERKEEKARPTGHAHVSRLLRQGWLPFPTKMTYWLVFKWVTFLIWAIFMHKAKMRQTVSGTLTEWERERVFTRVYCGTHSI